MPTVGKTDQLVLPLRNGQSPRNLQHSSKQGSCDESQEATNAFAVCPCVPFGEDSCFSYHKVCQTNQFLLQLGRPKLGKCTNVKYLRNIIQMFADRSDGITVSSNQHLLARPQCWRNFTFPQRKAPAKASIDQADTVVSGNFDRGQPATLQ